MSRKRVSSIAIVFSPDYDRPTLSRSRIRTAICARFAASATSVKSLRNMSVEADLVCGGCGGTILLKGDCWVEGSADVCCVVGDVMGAFMMGEGEGGVCLFLSSANEEATDRGRERERDRFDGSKR